MDLLADDTFIVTHPIESNSLASFGGDVIPTIFFGFLDLPFNLFTRFEHFCQRLSFKLKPHATQLPP